MIKGQDITDIRTIGSQFDNNCIMVWVGKKIYYMEVSEILKFNTDFNDLEFEVVKKKVREYLKVI